MSHPKPPPLSLSACLTLINPAPVWENIYARVSHAVESSDKEEKRWKRGGKRSENMGEREGEGEKERSKEGGGEKKAS